MRNPTIRLEILPTFAPCGLKSPPVEARHRGRVPRPSARRYDAADLGVGILSGESISSVVHFLSSCAFVLIQKHQKIKHGESSGRRHQCSPSGHKRLRCFARPLRALAPMSPLLPLFSQCDPADQRLAKIQLKDSLFGRSRRAATHSYPTIDPHPEILSGFLRRRTERIFNS